MAKIKIIFMDDDERQFEIAQSMLVGRQETEAEKLIKKRGRSKEEPGQDNEYILKWAKTGQEGLEMMLAEDKTEFPFDIALIDKSMPPGWDGLETMQKVRDLFPNTPLAMVTAYPMDQVMLSCLEKVNASLMQKPYSIESFHELIARLIKEKQNGIA